MNIWPALYRTLTAAAAPLVVLYLNARCRRGKEDGGRLGERFGIAAASRPAAPLVWVHAASVGEASSVLALVERILADRPGLEILMTTGTVAAARLVQSRLPNRARHQFVPVDVPRAVERFLDHWHPDLAIWVESELWPNLVLATHRRGIPMLLANARLSAGSLARWQVLPGLVRPVLRAFALCLGQDEVQAERFRRLGAGPVASVGDLKAAAAPLAADPAGLAALCRQVGTRPVWLAASTHAGEEEIAADAHLLIARDDTGIAPRRFPGLLTIIAPRHPVRGPAIAEMLRARGLRVARHSANQAIAPDTDIYLADTLGELGLFFRVAGIALIGGSLVRKGGHNPFEAARLDCAVLHGPEMTNCAAMAGALDADGAALTVGDAASLAAAVSLLLGDPAERTRRAAAAARIAAASGGVLDAVLHRFAPWLDALAPASTTAGALAPTTAAPPRGPGPRAEGQQPASMGADARPCEFWHARGGPIAGLLAPLGAAWDAAGRLRRAIVRPYRAPVPVICVGNLVAGGSGKTPVVLSLAGSLAAMGIAVHTVTRGYGGRLAGPVRVDAARHDASAVGDEAVLLAGRAPCWVARDRAAGVRAAVAAGADAILFDDGFQNPGVAQDLALVVVDADYGFGNRRVMPAGPLRESVAAGLARADAIVLIGAGAVPLEMRDAGRPIFHAMLEPVAGERLAGKSVVAFAGIGRPEKFFASLRGVGATLVAAHPFPDHHPFAEAEIAGLRREAERTGARLITTAKDWVRLAPPMRDGVLVLEVEIAWRDAAAVTQLLSDVLRRAPHRHRHGCDRDAARG